MKRFKISRVTLEDAEMVHSFLLKYEESSQFLITNLELHGPDSTDHPNSGNFKKITRGEELVGVFYLAKRGNLIIQLSCPVDESAIIDSCLQESIQWTGFIGHWESVELVYQRYLQMFPNYKPHFYSKEILYTLCLQNAESFGYHPSVRLMVPEDYPQWLRAQQHYLVDLGMKSDLSEEEMKANYLDAVERKGKWGMFEGSELLSMASLISVGKRVGQVGGVFTSRQNRCQGLSRQTLLHLLQNCVDDHGLQKSVLFTGEENLAARKTYESIGYENTGFFALILG